MKTAYKNHEYWERKTSEYDIYYYTNCEVMETIL